MQQKKFITSEVNSLISALSRHTACSQTQTRATVPFLERADLVANGLICLFTSQALYIHKYMCIRTCIHTLHILLSVEVSLIAKMM